MNIIVNGRHLEVTPALRQYAEDKIGRFTKYISNISEAIVTVSVEKHRQKAEVLLKVNGYMIQAEGATGDVYSAIDGVVEKLQKQVVKYKEKLSDHRKGDKKTVAHAAEPVREGRPGPPDLRFYALDTSAFETRSLGPFRLVNAWTIEDRSGRFEFR